MKTESFSRVVFSRKSDNWATPQDIYDKYMSLGYFDPCPLEPDFDWLHIDWQENCFVNPPYSEIRKWLEKAISEIEKGNCRKALFLIPARTDVRWFHDLIYNQYNIQFIKGRLKFGGSNNSAPFPSMFVWVKSK